MSDRPCTCHPDDNPPVPCPQKYALSECHAAASDETNLVQRLRALSDLCTWANAGWDLPPSACAKIRAIAAESADKITALRADLLNYLKGTK